MSDKVRCKKMTSAAYAALASPSPDTLHFVNDSGTFGPDSMETGGTLYLGALPIGGTGSGTPAPAFNPANPMANPQGLFFVSAGSQGNTANAWAATLDGLTDYYNGLKIVLYNDTGAASGTSLQLNLNTIGARIVRRYGSSAISAIPAGSCTLLTYVGSNLDGHWIMDAYVNTTYTLINASYTLGGFNSGSYGVKKYSLCAITADNKVSSFTTTPGTGAKNPVGLDFKIGQPLLYRVSSSDIAANTSLEASEFGISRNYIDMRYTGTGLTSAIGVGHDIYLEVTVNPGAGTYRPTERLLVTDAQLQADKFYIHVGRQQSADYWYRCTLLATNPLYHYDGTNFVPYDTWCANTLQAQLAQAYRYVDTEPSGLLQTTSTTSYYWSTALDTAIALASTTIDFDISLTLGTTNKTPFNVDVWAELRYYDETNEVWNNNTEVLAATSTVLASIPSADSNTTKMGATNVHLHAYAHHEQIVTSYGTAHLFVCVQCNNGEGEFTVRGTTPVASKHGASRVFKRHWVPATVAL